MKFTAVIDTILQSDPTDDWHQVSSGSTIKSAACSTSHMFLPDVNLRIEQSEEMYTRGYREANSGGLKPDGELLFRRFNIIYGATFTGTVSLYWFHERDLDTGKFPSLHPYLPTPVCGPDSCAFVCRLDYQIARILDPLGLVDEFMLKKGFVVESRLTGGQYLEGRRCQHRMATQQVVAMMALREQEASVKASLPPPGRHFFVALCRRRHPVRRRRCEETGR